MSLSSLPSVDRIRRSVEALAAACRDGRVAGLPGFGAKSQEKILEGKMASYFKDQVLMNQPYIKDESKTIRDLITEASQKFGERVEVTKFARFSAR